MTILERTVERRNNYVGAPIKRVSWASIFSGVVVGLAVSVALTVLGVAVGLLGPGSSPELGIVAGTTWAMIAALSLFVAGWTAGRLCGLRRSFEGALHGFVTWAVTSVVLLMFAGSFSLAFLQVPEQRTRAGLMGIDEMQPTARPGMALPSGAQGISKARKRIDRDCSALLDRATMDAGAKDVLKRELRPAIDALVDAVTAGDYAEARTRLIDSLLSSTSLPRAELEVAVDRWIDIANATQDNALERRKDRKRRRHVRERLQSPRSELLADPQAAAGWSFLFILLGAASAMFGGWLGSGSMNRQVVSSGSRPPGDEPTTRTPESESPLDD